MIPQNSPGCFGSALAYQKGSAVCAKCPFESDCAGLHQENLAALREKFGITTKKTVAERRSEGAVPKKVQDVINRITAAGINVRESLRKGQNPFPANMMVLRIATHVLLKMPQPLERDFISACIMNKLKWTEETADAQARIAVQTLQYLGAVEVDGKLVKAAA